MSDKRVYLFREGSANMRDLLGGKGANLCEMTNLNLPVPPGFTITTQVCRDYYAEGGRLPAGLMDEVHKAMNDIENDLNKKFGDSNNPLLVSVRSGAKFSMPGMMDTILNLGLNPTTLSAIIKQTNNPRFAWDAYRRFIMMFSNVVLDIPKEHFENLFQQYKTQKEANLDTDLSADDLEIVTQQFLNLVKEESGSPFPEDPFKQLEMAIEAVFRSWNNQRAIVYRRKEKIPDDLGTAVNIQAMVYGNMGDEQA